MDLSPEDGPGANRSDVVALAVAVALSGILTTLSPDDRAAVTAELRATVLAPVLWTHSTVRRHARLSRRLAELRAERDSLGRALAEARIRVATTRDLERVLPDAARTRTHVLPVRLEAGRRRTGTTRAFALESGRRHGVRAPAGVFTAAGVVGVVRWSGETSSRGDYWTHPDFRVSVRTRSGDASGIIRPSSEADQPEMILEGAPYQRDLAEGTVLYTSGLGGVYPGGVPVGTVRSVAGVESGWEKSYRVKPAVRPEQTDVAMVWLDASAPP